MVGERIFSILLHEYPVKLCLNFRMACSCFFRIAINIRMAAAVQHIMTDKSHRICKNRLVSRYKIPSLAMPEKIRRHLFMHPVSGLIHFIFLKRMIIKQDIRPMKPYNICHPVFFHDLLHLFRKLLKDSLPEQIMCICCRHVSNSYLVSTYNSDSAQQTVLRPVVLNNCSCCYI